MLGRYLRDSVDPVPSDAGQTYAEELMDSVQASVADRLRAGESGDVFEVVANALVDAEVESGLPAPPKAPAARDQFVRTYATLLLDNDRQAPSAQMSGRDMEKPRGLLGSFFTGAPTIQADAQSVLRFIEERFAQGRFGQARLLLQLFDTDRMTQRNNERNLFYEEMSQRFLSKRATPTPAGDGDPDAAMTLAEIGATLEHAFGIRLLTYGRDTAREASWGEVFTIAPPSARDVASRIVPGPRWRAHWRTEPPLAALAEHMRNRGVRAFVENLLRCSYFITLAPGSTGFEPVVMAMLDWVGANFEAVPTRILPRLHKDSTLGEMGIGEAIDAIWLDFFALGEAARRSFDDEALAASLERVSEGLRTADLSELPAGNYDLGGLVAAELLGFDAGDFGVALRMNRLT